MWVTSALDAVTCGDSWLSDNPPEVIWEPVQVEPSATDPDHPLVRIMLESRPDAKPPSAVTALPAISDLRFYSNLNGVPGVIFGPGDLRRVYLPDEYVSLDEVIDAALTLCKTIIRWTHSG